jgi:hypothetical protein
MRAAVDPSDLRGMTLTFWNWRRGPTASATQGSAALALSPDLVPIELYTLDSRIVGWIAPNGLRVTDMLNSRPEIRLWRPSPGPLDDKATPAANVDADEAAQSGEWHSLATEHIVLAMPPEWRASRQLRLHRRLDRAALVAGPFSVTGNIHLTPGVEIGPHLLRIQPFLPLTDAHILHTADPHFEHVVSVVIVNAEHVAQILPLVALA